MSLDPSAVKAHLSSKKSVPVDSQGGSGDTVTFGPISVPRESLIEDLFWLHGLSRSEDFTSAITMAWHKAIDRAGRERMSRIVHLYRLSQDGKSRPPFHWEEEYRRISGAPDLSFAPRPK